MKKRMPPELDYSVIDDGRLAAYYARNNPGVLSTGKLETLHQNGPIDDKTWNKNMTAKGIHDRYIY